MVDDYEDQDLKSQDSSNGNGLLRDQKFENAFKNEARVLCLLRSLKHPNIIELLASFSFPRLIKGELRYEHNFLFPLAESTLSSILANQKTDALSLYFETDQDLYEQLFGLSSAIESIHNYFSDEFNLTLIGCHHDLNHRNILVSENKLLLADFGLSRLRPENSRSLFKKGMGDYIAPECEPIQNGAFSTGIVGRASDIWSFGCVLSEVVTYKLFSGQGVKDFRVARENQVLPYWINRQFHAGGYEHPAVSHQLQVLEDRLDSRQKELPRLIREMLQIDPSKRPNAASATTRLFLHSQTSLATLIAEAFTKSQEHDADLELEIEIERFRLWAQSAGMLENDMIESLQHSGGRQSWICNSKHNFETIHTTLNALLHEAISLQTNLHHQEIVVIKPIYCPLRGIVDKLWFLLPSETRQSLSRSLDSRMLNSEDLEVLGQTSERFSADPDYKNLALLAAIKQMTWHVDHDVSNKTRRLLREGSVPIERSFGSHSLGSIANSGNGTSQSVLIEWRLYQAYWESQAARDEGYDRVEAVAELFNQPQLQLGLHVLRCTGYFHDLSRHAFGMIYEFPPALPPHARPISLKYFMRAHPRPFLGELFNLARGLVHCILQFHKTSWLHKNISSSNIIFFTTEPPKQEIMPATSPSPLPQERLLSHQQKGKAGFLKKRFTKKPPSTTLEVANNDARAISTSMSSSPALAPPTMKAKEKNVTADLTAWYLIGFNHSRQNTPKALTQGPSTDPQQIHYQHPNYTRGVSFNPLFEYYSLGLVLLEIGLWKPLSHMGNERLDSLTPKQQQRLWIEEFLPRLGGSMGETYRDAVGWCLRCGEASDGQAQEGSDRVQREAIEWFEANVASPLDRCFV